MKRLGMAGLSLLMVLMFSGCGGNSGEETITVDDSSVIETHSPAEPADGETCGFCEMKVHGKGDAMGAYTGQAITADGNSVFFDDSGCLLNIQRSEDTDYAAMYVRDAETLEWIEKDDAVVVKADIQTPMKYGFSFHKDEQSADSYIKEHSGEHAALSSWEDIDKIAEERYKKKMQHSESEGH